MRRRAEMAGDTSDAVKRRRRRGRYPFAGVVMTLSMVAAAGTADAQSDAPFGTPNPALFVAQDEDTVIYLFGTIHIVPCTDDAGSPDCASGITPAVRAALESANEVWLEIGETAEIVADPTSVLDLGMFGEGERLSDHIPQGELEAIAEAMARSLGLGDSIDTVATQIDSMRPWLVMMMLTVPDTSANEWGGGVDLEVAEIAETQNIPVFGFETVNEQVALLASDPLEYQIADLRSLAVLLQHDVDLFAINELTFSEMWQIWSDGRIEEFDLLAYADVDLMTEFTDAEIAESLGLTVSQYRIIDDEIAAFYPEEMEEERLFDIDAVLSDRNRNWMSDIEDMLDRPGTFFIAVGAAHMVGEVGLPALLEERGVMVKRIQ